MPLKGEKINKMPQRIDILGVKVDDVSRDLAIQRILDLARDKRGQHIVVTINSEFVMLARRDPNFAKILKNADLAVADGAGVVFSKLILGGSVKERVTGVELIEKLCEKSADGLIRIGFLGGFGRVADILAKRQKNKYPRLNLVFSQAGNPAMGYDLKLTKTLRTVQRIDILFVAYGMGQQEFWIERMKKRANVGVFIGVGGAFDYLAGGKRRAPTFLQNLGLEWLWRLVLDPARVWRMRVLPVFLVLVLIKSISLKLRKTL